MAPPDAPGASASSADGSSSNASNAAVPSSEASDDELERCTILHVDMDAFFAAVEVLDDPTLAGLPVVVGGTGHRGVVASCTYDARAYGIRSAMPSVEARRRCPTAIFLPGRFHRYEEMSTRLHEVLSSVTPVVEPIALDEAFLDVSGATRLLGTPLSIAWHLREAVHRELGLECSVGMARTKLLAKLASEAAKPTATLHGTLPGRGVVAVAPTEELRFLHALPVRALWGVGPATANRLVGLGVTTVAELAAVPEESLCRALGHAHGSHLAALARGEDPRVVVPERMAKSVGHEETFATDLRDPTALHGKVVRMADAVAARLVGAGLRGRTVTLKVRFADRSTITRAQSLAIATDSARAVRLVASALLEAVDAAPGVRLLGISVSGLTGAPAGLQLAFDELADAGAPGTEDPAGDRPRSAGSATVSRSPDRPPGAAPATGPAPDDLSWHEVEAAVAAVRARYGEGALAPAALLGREGVEVKRRGDTQWGPSVPEAPSS